MDRDPEKHRAWRRRAQDRARERAKEKPRAPLSRTNGLKRGQGPRGPRRERPPEGPLAPLEWKLAVYRQAGGLCEVSGVALAPVVNPWVWHAHHVIAKQTLRDRGLHHLAWDPRNGMLLATAVHMQHEGGGGASGTGRIPFEAIRPDTREFAVEIGPWAVDLLGPPLYPHAADPRNREGSSE